MPPRHPFLNHDGPIAFAHRGGLSQSPENTMAAFADAVSLGYLYVETDVHVTSDGVLVAFHDNDLERTCGIKGRIEDTPWSSLRTARVDGREPIPRLVEILDAFPELRVNIDCKTRQAEIPLINSLVDLKCLDRVCLGSFSDARLARFREALGPALCTSAGPREVGRLVLASRTHHRLGRGGRALAAQVPVSQGPISVVTRRFVETAHRLGLVVHVWTIDDPVEIGRLLDLGVDGIMSDDTRTLRDVFRARGLWA